MFTKVTNYVTGYLTRDMQGSDITLFYVYELASVCVANYQ